MKTEKACTCCHITKLLEDFPPHRKARDGRQSHCRVCSRAAWYAWDDRRKAAEAKRKASTEADANPDADQLGGSFHIENDRTAGGGSP